MGDISGRSGEVQFKTVSKIPRPYMNVVVQATAMPTEHFQCTKIILTRRGNAPNNLYNFLEQLIP